MSNLLTLALTWISLLNVLPLKLVSASTLAPVLKTIFHQVSYHILVASLTLMALLSEPLELYWLQVYDMTLDEKMF